jgi:hypothetical protein
VKRFVPTRWSHLLGFSGVGAVVRTDDELYVIRDIRDWTDHRNGQPGGEVIGRVKLLREAMRIDRTELRRPPLAKEGQNGIEGVPVPAQRFPRWTRCPRCGLLHWRPWHQDRQDGTSPMPSEQPRCSRCRPSPPALQQVGWVFAHQDGGLDDVPWHWMAHNQAERQGCREDREHPHPYLTLTRDPKRGFRWTLHCERCGSPAKPFDPGAKLPMADTTRQPWQRGPTPRREGRPPGQILEVSDPRLYFPQTRSGLVIPPESRRDPHSIVDRLSCNQRHCDEIARRRRSRGAVLARLADEYGCTKAVMEDAWRQIKEGYPNYGMADRKEQPALAEAEFGALCTPLPELNDTEDFVPRHQTDEWRSLTKGTSAESAPLIAAVDHLVALTRLREVRVFEGFTRVKQYAGDTLSPTADDPNEDNDTDRATLIPPDLDDSLDWLPALELFGEGIFFTLSEPMLARWAGQPALRKRALRLLRRFEASPLRFPALADDGPSARFILLHTLAHLLIRQLETQAGYPAASIRERIYCRDGDEPMAGILVYVAVPDIVGSLGGLAELAEPRRFLRLLGSLIAHADWCGTDPVCCEHEGQGPSQLNLAACHACTLVPEPSCAYGNALLDRVFVRGDLAGTVRPLLSFALD